MQTCADNPRVRHLVQLPTRHGFIEHMPCIALVRGYTGATICVTLYWYVSHLMKSTDCDRQHSGVLASGNQGAEYKPTLQGGKTGLSWQVLHHPMQCLLVYSSSCHTQIEMIESSFFNECIRMRTRSEREREGVTLIIREFGTCTPYEILQP